MSEFKDKFSTCPKCKGSPRCGDRVCNVCEGAGSVSEITGKPRPNLSELAKYIFDNCKESYAEYLFDNIFSTSLPIK